MRKQIGVYGTTVYILMVWTIFQELILGIMYHYIHVPIVIKLLFFSKDLLLVILYIIALLRTKLPRGFATLQWCYLPFVVFGAIKSLMTSQVSATAALSSSRGLILLPAFITIGYSIKHTEAFISIVKKRYMHLLVIVAAIGIIEYFLDSIIGTRKFWTDVVQLGTYMIDIKDAGNVVAANGLPGNFYTYGANGAYTQKRLVSFWAHPLTSGYVLVIPFFFYFISVVFSKKHILAGNYKAFLCLIIVSISLFLTFTRGTILPTIVVVIFCLLYRYRADGGRWFLYISGLLLVSLVGLVVYREKIFGYIYNGSTSAHLISLTSAIKEISLLGKGAGTFAAATTEGVWTESTYISIAGQLGIIAVIIYVILFLLPIIKVKKKHHYLDPLCKSVALAGLVFFFTGIISEQLCAYTAIAPYYILMGVAFGSAKKSNLMISELRIVYEGTK